MHFDLGWIKSPNSQGVGAGGGAGARRTQPLLLTLDTGVNTFTRTCIENK